MTRRFRVLPPGGHFGWTPWAWLVYLPTLFAEPFYYQRPAWQTALTLAGTVAFLVSYFVGYWLEAGTRGFFANVALEVLLGAALAPINSGSSVLFVYAAGFAGRRRAPRSARSA